MNLPTFGGFLWQMLVNTPRMDAFSETYAHLLLAYPYNSVYISSECAFPRASQPGGMIHGGIQVGSYKVGTPSSYNWGKTAPVSHL